MVLICGIYLTNLTHEQSNRSYRVVVSFVIVRSYTEVFFLTDVTSQRCCEYATFRVREAGKKLVV